MDNQERNKEIAATIIAQMGGARNLQLMLSAFNFVAIENGVEFRFKGSRKANHVRIVLTPMDEYDMTINQIRAFELKECKSFKGIYCDQLQECFEEFTGLYCRLV